VCHARHRGGREQPTVSVGVHARSTQLATQQAVRAPSWLTCPPAAGRWWVLQVRSACVQRQRSLQPHRAAAAV
jgi:hypothetical protein